MTTRRERLERKLEKRQEWAESREAKADAAQKRVHEIADQIPFGQPILVGHHSERHARKDQARIESGMRATVEHGKMADEHRSKADGLREQLDRAVFSDDEDAVERLTEIVAELEAKRDRMKAENDAFRKDPDTKVALKRMTPYERSQAVPHPSYALTNLGATIRQKKQRIEQIERERAQAKAGVRAGGRVMAARYGGECADCGREIERGSPITWYRSTREAVHVECPKTAREIVRDVEADGWTPEPVPEIRDAVEGILERERTREAGDG